MKNLKKNIALTLSGALLIGATFAFAGCGENLGEDLNVGKLRGNFENEASEAEIFAAIETVDSENLFGDRQGENWEAGLELIGNFHLQTQNSYRPRPNARPEEYAINSKISINYKLAADKKTMAGMGEMRINSTMTEGKSKTKVLDVTKTYNDGNYVYLSMAKDDESAMGTKYTLSEFFSRGGLNDICAGIENIATVCEKVYLDYTEGLKIKCCFGEEYVRQLITDYYCASGEEDEVTVNQSLYTVYLSVGTDGTLKSFSADIELGAMVKTVSGKSTQENSFHLTGGFAITPQEVLITLPEGIADDPFYLPIHRFG